MAFEGFIPYDPERTALYDKRRWWLGLTLGDMFDKTCDLYPNREALIGSGKRYTWSQLRVLVDNMAFRLLEAGFHRGDTVLLQLPNLPEFVVAYFALQKAGLVMVLLTVNHTAQVIGKPDPFLEIGTLFETKIVALEYLAVYVQRQVAVETY